MSFELDQLEAKEIEERVADILDCEYCMLTKGNFPYDILAVKDGRTFRIEVKYHRCPEKFIPYEVFSFLSMSPIGIASTEADFWVDVISEPEDRGKKTVWITNTEVLRGTLSNLIKAGTAISAVTKNDSCSKHAFILVPLEIVKSYAKSKGSFRLEEAS